MYGQAELTWVVGWTEINFPQWELNLDTVTHPSIVCVSCHVVGLLSSCHVGLCYFCLTQVLLPVYVIITSKLLRLTAVYSV